MSTDRSNLAALLNGPEASPSHKIVFSMAQRVRLARLLASAVLSFHQTPWMTAPWHSQDIILYNIDFDANSGQLLKEPEAFVEVPVQKQCLVAGKEIESTDPLAPLVHNSALFNLGVMLLELAFERPLRYLQNDADRARGMPPSITDFYTAVRVCKEAPSKLSITYGKIVEKCLRCDFGQGSELANPALQRAVQRDVVAELDRIEAGLTQLGIA